MNIYFMNFTVEGIYKEFGKNSGVELEYSGNFNKNIKKYIKNAKLMYKTLEIVSIICNNPNFGRKLVSNPRIRYCKIKLRTEYRIAYELKRSRENQTVGVTKPTIKFHLVDTRENFYKLLGR